MPRIKDQAIPIRHLDWSETSQVVVLLTQAHGKVRGLAKGSKRMTPSSVQRFSGGIELLTRGEIVMALRPGSVSGGGSPHASGSELATLTEWDLQDDYHHLRTDLHAHRLAMYAADLCHAFLQDLDPHPRSFAALARLLPALKSGEAAEKQAALLRFQWAILDDAGYRPELERDVQTGEGLGDAGGADAGMFTFDPRAGGMTTGVRVTGADWRIRRATVEALRAVAEGDGAPTSSPAAADPDTLLRANKFLCAYARTILDQELPTMKIVLTGGGE